MSWSGLGKKSEWGTWGLSTRQQLGKCLANWYEGTAWSGLRQACGTMGTRVLGVAQLAGPVAVRLFIASAWWVDLKVGWDGRISNPQAVTALLWYSVSCHFIELALVGVTTQGTPGSTCHQQDGLYGADNGWMDNTLAVDSGKWGWGSALMGDDHVPIMENMLGIVGGPNQLHRLVKLNICRQGGWLLTWDRLTVLNAEWRQRCAQVPW